MEYLIWIGTAAMVVGFLLIARFLAHREQIFRAYAEEALRPYPQESDVPPEVLKKIVQRGVLLAMQKCSLGLALIIVGAVLVGVGAS